MIAGQVSDTMGLAATDLVVNALSPDHHDSGMLRRDVLCGGGAAMLGSKLRTELPVYLGGEECFCTREWIVGEPQDFGYLKRKALADAKVKVVFAETPAMLADHAFHHGPDPFSDLRESVGADANDCRNARRDRLLPRQASGGEARDPRRPGRFRA